MGTKYKLTDEDRLRLQIAQRVADEEGLDIETVLDCWLKFRKLPPEVQDQWLAEVHH
jgi:hypothetical protein